MAHLKNFSSSLILLLSFTSASISKRQIDPEIERKINEYIHNVYLPAAKVSTLALTIVQNDGEVLYTNGYGWANEEKQIPNTNETLFHIASVTKTFTALVLVKTLNEKFPELGEAVLDTPIRKLLPEYNFTLIDRFRSEHGTIRDLLAHRMCLPTSDWSYHADAYDTAAEAAYRQRYNEEMCGIRTDFQYQNHIFILAGQILSFLSGKSYEDTVEEFMRQLGMDRSRFVKKTDDFANTPEIARPYYVDINDGTVVPVNPKLPLRVVTGNAAGGLLLSSNEVERYLRLYINLGNIDGKQLVPEHVMEWMRKPAMHVPLNMFPHGYAYGQGLILAEYGGWEWIYHGGDLSPYFSMLSFFPSNKLGIFTSTNQGPLQTDRTVLHSFILDVMNGVEDAEEKANKVMKEFKLKAEQKNKNHGKTVEKFLQKSAENAGPLKKHAEELVGKYGSGPLGDAEILEKWNNETNAMGLYIQYGKWATGWLEHVEGPIYKILFDTDIMQYFAGLQDLFYLRVDNDEIEFIAIADGEESSQGKFKFGVSLDKLPPIPWLPESCPLLN